MALMHLFQIRSGRQKRNDRQALRQVDRYKLPIKMFLEVPPVGNLKSPLLIEGYSSDISIGGICVVLNGKSKHVPNLLDDLLKANNRNKVRISFPGDTMELKVAGTIVWHHQIYFNRNKTLAVGIQFEDDTPKMRGMLFMFARSLGRIDDDVETY
jgi:hypothetical protein